MLPTVMERHALGQVRVARLGEGPPLVLLHGYPDNLQIFCALAPLLATRFQVIAFDWPGMGYSDPWPGGATPTHLAERLVALLDAWSIDRATLVGMDMGGQPALALAARHPDRVARLVVMNSLVQWDAETSWEIRVLRRFRWNELILRTLPRVVFTRAERTFLPRGVRLPDPLRADLWDSFSRPDVRRTVARMCGGYQGALPRLARSYPEIRCPVLALWAGRDKHFPPVHAERLCQAIPGSELEVLPEAEHWMAWHLAGVVAERILRFAAPPSPTRM